METTDSSLNAEALARARELLTPRKKKERIWPVLGAAFLAAFCALAFATAMLLAPPVSSYHAVQSAP